MPLHSRIVMTILVFALLTPFLFLFGKLWASRFAASEDRAAASEAEFKLRNRIQAENNALAASGEPAVAELVTETWICLSSNLGNYATVEAHDKLAIPGLLLASSLLVLTLYCIWIPVRG